MGRASQLKGGGLFINGPLQEEVEEERKTAEKSQSETFHDKYFAVCRRSMAASRSRKTDGFSRQLGSSRSAAATVGKEGDGLKGFLFYL